MKTLEQYFDKAKDITGSDYKTAKRLGMSTSRISTARNKGQMSNAFCEELAELIGCNPLEVIAAAEVKKHPESRQRWERWVAAVAIVTSTGIGYSPSQSTAYGDSRILPSIHYAQLKAKLRRSIRKAQNQKSTKNDDKRLSTRRRAIDRRHPHAP